MPVIEAAALKRHTTPLYPVYFLHGDEKYLLKKAQNRLVTLAAGTQFGTFNYNEFKSETTVDAIADAALAMPFMAEHKCVLVQDFNVEALSQTEFAKLQELLEAPNESTVLIFSLPTILNEGRKGAKWRSFQKLVEAKGASVAFAHLEQGGLVKFICKQAQAMDSDISKQNAIRIVEYAGQDLTNLKNEVHKLAAYAKDREILETDIEAVVVKNLETTVFILIKSILSCNYSKAYALLHLLFASGEKGVPILAVLSATFVDLYRVRAAIESGKSAMAPAAYGEYKGKEFRLRNAERDTRGLTTQNICGYLELLLETDLLLKGSRLSDKLILEELIAKLLLQTKGGGKP